MQEHPTTSPSTGAGPLKWAGGKQRLLPQLRRLLAPAERLIEPFVGGGSVFLGTSYPRYLLNDANTAVSEFWSALKTDCKSLMRQAQPFFDDAYRSDEAYRRIRDEFNASVCTIEKSAQLLYLNRFCFNGIYRVNRMGKFNVPYGKPNKVPSFPADRCLFAGEKLKSADIMSGDFEPAMGNGGIGDVIYCDPPYLASDRGSSFTSYTATPFGMTEHLRLVSAARAAARRGATVLISNHDTPETRALYSGMELHALTVRRSVSANAAKRGMAGELVAILRPTGG